MPDWNAIKSEYITEDISYRKLADKWGVSFRTLADHARKESWNKERNTHRDNVTKQTVQKIAARQSSDGAYKLLRLQEAADSIGDVIASIFGDADQFHRHIVEDGNYSVEERVYKKVDTKAIKDLTGAMKDLAYVLRNVYDLPTKQEQVTLDNAAERLRIEKAKAEEGKEDTKEISVEFFSEEERGWSA